MTTPITNLITRAVLTGSAFAFSFALVSISWRCRGIRCQQSQADLAAFYRVKFRMPDARRRFLPVRKSGTVVVVSVPATAGLLVPLTVSAVEACVTSTPACSLRVMRNGAESGLRVGSVRR